MVTSILNRSLFDSETRSFSLFQQKTQKILSVTDQALQQVLSSQTVSSELQRAMSYATLNGGKRLRPIIMAAFAELLDVSWADMIPAAVAVECVHAYSLIHDDLPAMDNAAFRRGLPSCWKQFGEATAILAGDALLTLAFEVLAHAGYTEKTAIKLISTLAQSSGANGMVGGQMHDLLQTHQGDVEGIRTLHQLKTGALFSFCCMVPAVVKESNAVALCRRMGEAIGLIYQIKDDFLDSFSTPESIGKPTQQDAQKTTFISLLGEKQAADLMNERLAFVQRSMKEIAEDRDASFLTLLLQYLSQRSF